MKTFFILRHAKSSWQQPGLADHDRPLNKRGARAAPRMGRLMCEEGLVPERIISSTAQRARTTTELVVQSGGFCGEIVFTGDLYHAPPQRVVVVLRAVPDDVASVLVVGHNPGLEELLDLLTGAGLPMPTAALAQVELPIRSWRDLQVTTKGSLVNFWRPRELAELA